MLLGVNEQVNCNDCVSAFGSAGSFSAGIHGRKNLTPNLSLLAGIAYAQYNEGGYHVTSAPIGAFALRYDFVDWGSSRPFFDIGTILSPFQKVRYARSYTTSLGAVSLESSTSSENYAVYGRAGWMSRLSPRDEVAASVEVWQLWQRVQGLHGSSRRRSIRSTPRSPRVPTAPISSSSADNGRIGSAVASRPISSAGGAILRDEIASSPP